MWASTMVNAKCPSTVSVTIAALLTLTSAVLATATCALIVVAVDIDFMSHWPLVHALVPVTAGAGVGTVFAAVVPHITASLALSRSVSEPPRS